MDALFKWFVELSQEKRTRPRRGANLRRCRRGAATIDYVLVIGIVLPLAYVVLRIAPRLMAGVYEMYCVFVSGPVM